MDLYLVTCGDCNRPSTLCGGDFVMTSIYGSEREKDWLTFGGKSRVTLGKM